MSKKIYGKILSISCKNTKESSLRIYNCGFESEQVVIKHEDDRLIIQRTGISYVGKSKKMYFHKNYNFGQISFNQKLRPGKYELDTASDEDILIFDLSMPIVEETCVELAGIEDDEFTVICMNGKAYANGEKYEFTLKYPKIEELENHQIEYALMYRGLSLDSKPTYGDIMISYGVIQD